MKEGGSTDSGGADGGQSGSAGAAGGQAGSGGAAGGQAGSGGAAGRRADSGDPDHAEFSPAPSSGEDVYHCDLCGAVMLNLHCKLICERCGYKRDCSDP